MKCKRCRSIATGNFCANCGKPTATEAEIFHSYRKRKMKDVQDMAKRTVGQENCWSEIGKAAWAIAASRPQDADSLYGSKAGDPKSYVLLYEIALDAYALVSLLDNVRLAHNDGKLAQVQSAIAKVLHKETNDGNNVVSKQTKDKSEKHKKYLKRTISAFIGFLLGFIGSRLLRHFCFGG